MIDFLYAAILGIIQGLTEFWPISSSGHLVLAHDLLQFDVANDLSFDVALHIGTLLALIIFFWADIRRYSVAFVRSIANFQVRTNADQRMAWLIILGTVPAAIAGYLFAVAIESSLRAVWLVALMLIIGGILFIVVERVAKKQKQLPDLGWKGALTVGIAQALALVPGVSRSGATICTGMAIGFTRETAARFSFLLSIPIVFGAGAKKMLDLAEAGIGEREWLMMLVGLLASAIVGYIAIKFLLRFLAKHPLNVFGWYRIALGIILLFITWLS